MDTEKTSAVVAMYQFPIGKGKVRNQNECEIHTVNVSIPNRER